MRLSRQGGFTAVATVALLATGVHAASPWPPSARARAAALVAQMTNDEKISLVHGIGMNLVNQGYVGATAALPRLSIPLLGLEDGPQGVADGVLDVTAWPSALTVAMTFDAEAAYAYGQGMGAEQRAKGSAVMLGPGTNLARIPWGGRNFEYLGEDPALASVLAANIVRGVQSNNISACIKHFVFNNQEHNRDSVSANVPQRAAYELYLRPFWAAVDAGVGSAMCSYNRINNTYACENDATLAGYLKGEGGFDGWLMSDWGATHSTVPAALAGLDQEMPDSQYFGAPLAAAVANGSVPQSRLDDMVTRLLTGLAGVGFLDDPLTPGDNLNATATSPAHAALARALATQSAVLLKNDPVAAAAPAAAGDGAGAAGPVLPLSAGALTSIAVLGDAATFYGGGSGSVVPPYHTTPYEAIFARANGAAPVPRPAAACTGAGGGSVSNGTDATPLDTGAFVCMEGVVGAAACAARCAGVAGCNGWTWTPNRRCNGWGWGVDWLGTCSVYEAGSATPAKKAGVVSGSCRPSPAAPSPGRVNVTAYMGADPAVAAALAAAADVVVISVGLTCSEGEDRQGLALPAWQDALVAAAAAANPRTVVAVRAAGPILMPWAGAVPAILFQGMPGQEAANALADLLFGAANPAGKLPVSFPGAEGDTWLGTNASQYPGTDRGKGWLEADYSEGLNIGYRWYDLPGSPAPLWPFGHGLSYSSFSYAALAVSGDMARDGAVSVSFTLAAAAGSPAGTEVAQVYIAHPPAAGEPPKVLACFVRVPVPAGGGAPQPAQCSVTAAAARVWDVAAHAWALVPGAYRVLVGASSGDIRLAGGFSV